MQCPLLKSDCEINFKNGTVSVPFIKMTLDLMRSFCKNNHLNYTFKNNSIKLENVAIKMRILAMILSRMPQLQVIL